MSSETRRSIIGRIDFSITGMFIAGARTYDIWISS